MIKTLIFMAVMLTTRIMGYEYTNEQEFSDDSQWYDNINIKAREYAESDCKKALDFLDNSSNDPRWEKLGCDNEINKIYYKTLSSNFNKCTDKYNDLAVKYLKIYADNELKNVKSFIADKAAFDLAKVYDWGSLGQKKDKSKALEYYLKGYNRMAIIQRGWWETFLIGKYYYEMGNKKEAYPYLWLSARKNNSEASSLMEKLCTESPNSCKNTPKPIAVISENNALRLQSQGQKLLCFIELTPTLVDLSFDVEKNEGKAFFIKKKKNGIWTESSIFSAETCVLPTEIISKTDYLEGK